MRRRYINTAEEEDILVNDLRNGIPLPAYKGSDFFDFLPPKFSYVVLED